MTKSQLTKKIKEVTKTEPTEKITRCFAVADKSKPRLGKLKEATYHKFANTPNHIYMYNKDLKDFDVRKIGLDIE
ncbi:MAG: hypothetical protein MJ224_00035 [archaeon]|nr:hypothetical protein [archaeon]